MTKQLPITPSTVLILGSAHPGKCTIWAGLYLHEANLVGDRLRVPWCHVDDVRPAGECFYKIDPKDERYQFARATNGNWILRLRA